MNRMNGVFAGSLLTLFAGCAPSTIAPAPALGYTNTGPFTPFIATPLAARVQKADDTGFGIKTGPSGLGFEVTKGAWGVELMVPNSTGYGVTASAFARGSYVQEKGLMAAVSLGWQTYYRYRYTDQPPYYSAYEPVNGGGIGLDLGYIFSIPLETGRGYFGPRIYTYVNCESTNNAALSCVGPRFNPSLVVGVNVKVFERWLIAPEASLFLLPPDEYFNSIRFTTPFSVSLSFRF
jgi:hypothetical protein